MTNGTIRKTPVDKCRFDISHIPVGSEEIISTESAILTIGKISPKEVWVRLAIAGVYDGDYFDVAGLTEQALLACLPDGCWVTGRDPFGSTTVR